MHPRNRHRNGYDFLRLVAASPALARFVRPNPFGDTSIDFANPEAVKELNRALLKEAYGIERWDIPAGYLCPPIPGRADYIHHLADLLAEQNGGAIPRGAAVTLLDIGAGANCIYPMLGVHEYGWRFVGSEVDAVALESAQATVAGNPALRGLIELRLQRSPSAIFDGIVAPGEVFAVSMCNPPFHASAADAAAGTRRKVRNLSGRSKAGPAVLNFGGQRHELWCRGGELAFIRQIIAESARFAGACRWFTTLVSKRDNLTLIDRALTTARAVEVRTIEMAQGQKKSRIVAWRF